MDRSVASDTRLAYDELAHVYDGLTAHHDHEAWLGQLLELATAYGLAGRRLLDVGCGTGKSFMPLARRGFDVTACDISPRMAARARRRSRGHGVVVHVADMRRLPLLCEGADLVTCLDDAVNYLLTEGDVRATFAGIGRALRPGGLFAFDVNSLRTYGSVFVTETEVERGDATFVWRGEPRPRISAGQLYRATVEIAPKGNGHGRIESVHTQRHYPRDTIERLLRAAGLRPVTVFGQAKGGRLLPEADEELHGKLLYVAKRKEALW
jgi:SAM-dependent methyltransferase